MLPISEQVASYILCNFAKGIWFDNIQETMQEIKRGYPAVLRNGDKIVYLPEIPGWYIKSYKRV